MPVELSPENAVEYLRRHGVLSPTESASAVTLGGGISNRVVAVDSRSRRLVCKQPRANLAVEEDWPADVERVHNEAAAARAYGRILDTMRIASGRVPEVIFESTDDHVVVFSRAPPDTSMWKELLLDGSVDERVAHTLGHLLGTVQDAAEGDDELRAQFENDAPFVQLRIDPYHRTVARRHPDVASEIRSEVERTLSAGVTLVHGDFSPKNVLVTSAERGPTAWILDFEVAHWGDPAFDAAFLVNHLCLKSVYNRDRRDAYLDAARTFWRAYEDATEWDVERETTRELAVLMLARIDGKSPVEYIDEGPAADVIRATAKRTIREEVNTLDGVLEFVAEEDERR